MIRQTVARIDLHALKSNYQQIVDYLETGSGVVFPSEVKNISRPRTGVIAVVKANAYGHGAGQVALALEDAGADLLACADIEEGAALRAAAKTRSYCPDAGVLDAIRTAGVNQAVSSSRKTSDAPDKPITTPGKPCLLT